MDTDTASQMKNILSHLRSGRTLTFLECLNLYGCMNLKGRICDLRRLKHTITTTFIKLPNGKRVAEYKLVTP